MTDTWITPRVWVAGEKVTASKKNDESNNFRVLFPYTTAGDMAYRAAGGAYLTRLAPGAVGDQLFFGSAPAWGSGERYIPVSLNADVALTTGDGKGWFGIPTGLNGWNISSVLAWRASGGTGVPEFQIRNITDSVDVLSTKISIDSGEVFSGTAATPCVIDATKDDVATGDQFAVDVDVAGTNTFYCQVYVGFKRP